MSDRDDTWGEDMRRPGEAFCGDCPDHEACGTGWPCWKVREVAGLDDEAGA